MVIEERPISAAAEQVTAEVFYGRAPQLAFYVTQPLGSCRRSRPPWDSRAAFHPSSGPCHFRPVEAGRKVVCVWMSRAVKSNPTRSNQEE